MKKVVLGLIALGCAVAVNVAQARDTVHHLPIKDVIEMGKAQGKLSNAVQFYFGNTPAPASTPIAPGLVSNKKTNGANKTDEEACQIAALSVLMQFEKTALSRGGNAVTNMISFYKKVPYTSNDMFECHAGSFVVGVALKGDVVKTK